MLKTLLPITSAALLATTALPVAAQPYRGPTPAELVGMFTGTNAANGSAVIVTDRHGTHPEGYPGMSITNRTSASNGAEGRQPRDQHPWTEPRGR